MRTGFPSSPTALASPLRGRRNTQHSLPGHSTAHLLTYDDRVPLCLPTHRHMPPRILTLCCQLAAMAQHLRDGGEGTGGHPVFPRGIRLPRVQSLSGSHRGAPNMGSPRVMSQKCSIHAWASAASLTPRACPDLTTVSYTTTAHTTTHPTQHTTSRNDTSLQLELSKPWSESPVAPVG